MNKLLSPEELAPLEQKIAQVLRLCQQLRLENADLQKQLSLANDEKAQITHRLNTARERLEQIVEHLPVNAK
ncbi:MAG: hypothetical protein V4623_00365 [Pseudomonadota bacterium]